MRKLVEVALFTRDVPATARFYEAMVGAPPTVAGEGMVEFHLGGLTLRIHAHHEEQPGRPPSADHLAFRVEDAEQVCGDLTLDGIETELGPMDFPWGTSAYLHDPDGRLVELAE